MSARRLAFLQRLERRHGLLAHATAARKARQAWIDLIAACAEDGEVAVIVWQRDCDMCEGTHRAFVPATVAEVDAYCRVQLSCAEGPMRFDIARPSEPFETDFRDRAFEAFEDGHPYAIY